MFQSRKNSGKWILTIAIVGIISVCVIACFIPLKPLTQKVKSVITHKSRHGDSSWVFPYVSPNHRYIALNSFGNHTYVLIRRLIPKGGKDVYLNEKTIFPGDNVPWFNNSDKLVVAKIQKNKSYYYIVTPTGQILDRVRIAKYLASTATAPSLDGRYVALGAEGIPNSYICVWSLQSHSLKYINIPGGVYVNISYISWINSRDIMIFTELRLPRKSTYKKSIFILHIPPFKLQRCSVKINGEIDSYTEAVAPYANALGQVASIVKTKTGCQLALINPNSDKINYIPLPSSKSGWHIRWASQRLLIVWQRIPLGKIEVIKCGVSAGIIGKPILLPSYSQFSNDKYGNIWYVNEYGGKLKMLKFD